MGPVILCGPPSSAVLSLLTKLTPLTATHAPVLPSPASLPAAQERPCSSWRTLAAASLAQKQLHLWW